MSSKRPLPQHSPDRPTVDMMRRQLGGRLGDLGMENAGRPVLADGGGGIIEGLLVCVDDAHAFVWTGENEFRRLPADAWRPSDSPLDAETLARTEDLRRFAMLRERQRVRFVTARGVSLEGTLIEKCRFGALVAREDGVVVAVGFRSLFPGEVH